jgi:hypothetical protein
MSISSNDTPFVSGTAIVDHAQARKHAVDKRKKATLKKLY